MAGQRTIYRAEAPASPERDRRKTGERKRAPALEAASQLGHSAASIVALQAVSEAVVITDRNGVIVFANPAFRALCGSTSESVHPLMGRRMVELLEPDHTVRDVVDALRHEPTWCGSLLLRHESGRQVPIDLRVERSIDIEPHTSHFVLIAKRTAPAATEPKNLLDAVGRLASEVAHDFNNQIAVVLNYTFILLRQLEDDSPLKEHVPQMQAAAWRASEVAQELLAFGRPRLTDLEDLDLNAIVANLEALLRHALQEELVVIEFQAAPALWPVRARLPHLEWLLIELALHARRTLGNVTQVRIETRNVQNTKSPGSATDNATGREVLLLVHAWPGHEDTSGMFRNGGLLGRSLPEDPSTMPGVEVALTHSNGTLTSTRGADGNISYCLRLPARG